MFGFFWPFEKMILLIKRFTTVLHMLFWFHYDPKLNKIERCFLDRADNDELSINPPNKWNSHKRFYYAISANGLSYPHLVHTLSVFRIRINPTSNAKHLNNDGHIKLHCSIRSEDTSNNCHCFWPFLRFRSSLWIVFYYCRNGLCVNVVRYLIWSSTSQAIIEMFFLFYATSSK